MMRQRGLRAAIGQRFHRVRRIHVLVAHEPARLIGADREGSPAAADHALRQRAENACRRRSRNRRRCRACRRASPIRNSPTAPCCGRTARAPTSAQALVMAACPPLAPEALPLAAALGCVLAEDITAREMVPPFDNTAVDGYAVQAADTAACPGRAARCVGVLAAGAAPSVPIGPGQAMRIMTGAPLPRRCRRRRDGGGHRDARRRRACASPGPSPRARRCAASATTSSRARSC